MLTINL